MVLLVGASLTIAACDQSSANTEMPRPDIIVNLFQDGARR